MNWAGMTPVGALRTATIEAAAALHLENSIGRIAPGYSADLIVLDADPLNRLENLMSPTA